MDLEALTNSLNEIAGEEIASVGRPTPIEWISTGILGLDAALGGGLPKGRVVEVHANFSVGKSSLCYAFIASYQKQGLICALVDTEFTFSSEYAKKFGVDIEKLILVHATTGEQAFEVMEKMARAGVNLIIVDSVSGLVPTAVAEAEHGKAMMGGQARLISVGLMKVVGVLSRMGGTLVFVNQLRANITGGQYDPWTLPGGHSLKFYSSIMLDLKKTDKLKSGERIIGQEIKIVVKKNKCAPTLGEECAVQLFFEQGISSETDVMDAAIKLGVITLEGKTYFFNEQKLGVGQANARKFLEGNPEIIEQIKNRLLSGS